MWVGNVSIGYVHVFLCLCLVSSTASSYMTLLAVQLESQLLHSLSRFLTCSAAGNHILAVFKQPKSYDCLKVALEDIIKKVEELKEVQVDGNKFKIDYYLGGDWKFLAMVTGIDAASRKHITPYIHALMNHVGEFLKIHRSILPFTQQGLEKKNNVLTKAYFRSLNHQGEVALQLILEKQNRIEHLETIGMKKTKVVDIHCQSRLTCSNPCKVCDYTPYRKHLVECNNIKVTVRERKL